MAARLLAPDQVEEAGRILRAGGLVGFPTDTVYGIAALADNAFDSVHLRAFKGGRPEPFSLHLPDADAAVKLGGPLNEPEEYAVRALGPRGFTVIVAHGPDNAGLGLRIVQHEVGSRFLALAGGPVVATSANKHGEPPLNDPVAIAALPGVAAVLSAGVLPERPASTVVRLLRCGLEILRQGEFDYLDFVKIFARRIHFVCMGNLNRSAFARALLMRMLRYYDGALQNFLQSWAPNCSGLIANTASRPPQPMLDAAAAYEVDMSRHVPQRLIPDEPATYVAMGPDVWDAVPGARRWNILDPMGRPPEAYVEMARQVRAEFETLFARTARVRPADAGLEAHFDVLFSAKPEKGQ